MMTEESNGTTKGEWNMLNAIRNAAGKPVDPTRTALVIIDMEKAFVEPKGGHCIAMAREIGRAHV